jgi:hypothetical protein
MKLIITEPTNNKNNAYEILRAYFLYNDVYVPNNSLYGIRRLGVLNTG